MSLAKALDELETMSLDQKSFMDADDIGDEKFITTTILMGAPNKTEFSKMEKAYNWTSSGRGVVTHITEAGTSQRGLGQEEAIGHRKERTLEI